MGVDEQQARIRRSLEGKLGVEEAAFLMDQPAGGWSSLVTTEELDRRLEALEARLDYRFESIRHELRADFREHTNRLILWIVPTIFAGIAAMGGAAALIRG